MESMSPSIEFLKRFFLFKAFSPDTQNPNIPLLERVGNKKVALLSVGSCGLKSATLTKGKDGPVISDIDSITMRLQDDVTDHPFLAALPKKTDCGLVVLCLGWKFMLNTEQNKLKNNTELNMELQVNAQSVMGSKFQANKRYMGLLSEDRKYSMISDIEEDLIQSVEDTLSNYNLKVIRAQIGLMSMMNVMFSDPEVISSSLANIPLLHDNGHVVVMVRQENRMNLRLFTSMIDTKPDNQVVERSSKLIERLGEILKSSRPGKDTVFWVADTGLPNIEKVMDNFCATIKHDAKVSWKPYTVEGVPPNALEFKGITLN